MSDQASQEAEERRRATAELASSERSDRGAQLIKSLGDVDWRVRKEAIGVAINVAEPWNLFDGLVTAICQGENVGLRNAALEVLERLGPRSAPALLSALPRVPEGARKFVVAALGFAGGAGVEDLARLSDDKEPNTAQAALEALARIGGPRAEQALRRHLRASDPVHRLAALEGLERSDTQLSLSDLEPLLQDRLVRRPAMRMLGKSGDTRAVGPLFDALEEANAPVAHEAVLGLGQLLLRRGPAAQEVLRRVSSLSAGARTTLRNLIAVGRDPARESACTLLLWARDRAVLAAMADLLSQDRLQASALDALRAWGSDVVIPLVEVSVELAPRARAAALEVAADLARLKPDAEAVANLRAALRAALRSDDEAPAAAAAAALVDLAEPGDAAALVAAAQKHPEHAGPAVGRALAGLAKDAQGEVEGAVLAQELDGALGAALLPAVAALGDAAANDRLQAALSADDARARRAAVQALPQLGSERAVELAGFALADEDPDVQVAAVHVLAKLRDDAGAAIGAEPLRLALRTSTEPVIAAAARALGAIGDAASLPVLRDLVKEGRPAIAIAATEALRALGDPGLEELLVGTLDRGDEGLVKEALRALAEIPGPARTARLVRGLSHPAWDVRALAASLLSRAKDPAIAPALKERLAQEQDESVRTAIYEALAALEARR